MSKALSREQFLCDACGRAIEGAYASVGGNWVPFIEAKIYHLGCVPTVRELLGREAAFELAG